LLHNLTMKALIMHAVSVIWTRDLIHVALSFIMRPPSHSHAEFQIKT
jgi:hypothetical protein